jgi:2-dehydro-3-deoxyphosphogluconate aldolase/(4S)-4-hydroxy-2-oxoglutarate aldolase
MKRAEVCRSMEEVGIVPVLRLPSAPLVIRAAEAILAGGIPFFEVTMTVPGAVDLIRSLTARFAGRAIVGAGTVLSAKEAAACIDAGAAFIVSPGLDGAMVEAAHDRDVAVMPGALTPTEVIAAWKMGADMVKIFPCSAVGGAAYLRALRAPLPHVKLLPTGGVNPSTLRDYIVAGASAVGMGSELVDRTALEAGRDADLTERARDLVATIRAARSESRIGAA